MFDVMVTLTVTKSLVSASAVVAVWDGRFVPNAGDKFTRSMAGIRPLSVTQFPKGG
jgi:hypothetical protein